MIWNISWPHVYWTGLVLRNENKKSKRFRLTATCWFFIDWPLVPWEQKSPVHPGLHRHSKLLLHVPWTQPGNKAQSRQSSPAYPAHFNNWIKYRSLATFILKNVWGQDLSCSDILPVLCSGHWEDHNLSKKDNGNWHSSLPAWIYY
jgi:hypothetical protein